MLSISKVDREITAGPLSNDVLDGDEQGEAVVANVVVPFPTVLRHEPAYVLLASPLPSWCSGPELTGESFSSSAVKTVQCAGPLTAMALGACRSVAERPMAPENSTVYNLDEHTKKKRTRPCKMKRVRCKQMLALFDPVPEQELHQLLEQAEVSVEGDYMRAIMKYRHCHLP
mmetsp:Transcript_59775/g.159102  ORF Transcript_59775/g.159102 Transcript_59775/m.159102 type:complete len:172 (-) Transcript_59775:93-608(-)